MHIEHLKLITRSLFLIFIGIIIGIFPFQYVGSFLEVQKIQNDVKKFYELLIPNSIVSVESVKKEGEMYKVLVKVVVNNNINYLEAWVSKDSSVLVEGVIYLKDSINSLERYKKFVECLNDRGVRIYGLLDSQNYPDAALLTSQQLNMLGRYFYLIFISCDGNMMQACINAGITQFPAVVHDNKIYFGLRDVNWFSSITGCKL